MVFVGLYLDAFLGGGEEAVAVGCDVETVLCFDHVATELDKFLCHRSDPVGLLFTRMRDTLDIGRCIQKWRQGGKGEKGV